MNLESDKRLNIQLRLDFSSAPTGETRQAGREDIESLSVVNESERPANTSRIMEEVCERANLKEALRQVRRNKGSVPTAAGGATRRGSSAAVYRARLRMGDRSRSGKILRSSQS